MASLLKTATRSLTGRAETFDDDDLAHATDPIHLKLGEGQELLYDDGRWVPSTNGIASARDEEDAKREIRRLEGENRMYHVQVEVLTELLALTADDMDDLKRDYESLVDNRERQKEAVARLRDKCLEGNAEPS